MTELSCAVVQAPSAVWGPPARRRWWQCQVQPQQLRPPLTLPEPVRLSQGHLLTMTQSQRCCLILLFLLFLLLPWYWAWPTCVQTKRWLGPGKGLGLALGVQWGACTTRR